MCYADKLFEPKVYDLFLAILENGRKLSKCKTSVEELEAKIQECHDKGVEDENVANKAKSAKNKTQKKGT